jgi:hypothetical protein
MDNQLWFAATGVGLSIPKTGSNRQRPQPRQHDENCEYQSSREIDSAATIWMAETSLSAGDF